MKNARIVKIIILAILIIPSIFVVSHGLSLRASYKGYSKELSEMQSKIDNIEKESKVITKPGEIQDIVKHANGVRSIDMISIVEGKAGAEKVVRTLTVDDISSIDSNCKVVLDLTAEDPNTCLSYFASKSLYYTYVRLEGKTIQIGVMVKGEK